MYSNGKRERSGTRGGRILNAVRGARWRALIFGALTVAACSSGTSSKPGDTSNNVIPTNCGNGTLDPGEQCDASLMTTGATCSSATMGAMASGALGCTNQCTFDLSGCTSAVSGAGGTPGAGNVGQAGTPIGQAGTPITMPGTGGMGTDIPPIGDGGTSGGGTAGATGSGGTPIMGSGDPKLPAAPADCPQIKTGTIQVMGQSVTISAGVKTAGQHGSVMLYWHGTGSSAAEVALLGGAVQEIVAGGGVVASFSTSLATGTNTGDAVWYTDDFKMADVIVACAAAQLDIDPHKIYTAGCSAGGLQAGAMVYSRASYLAAAMPNSGGAILPFPKDDMTHVPSLITAHGGTSDMVVIAFSTTSKNECMQVKSAGGIAVDCDHGGGHCQAPAALIASQWQFCKDHPYGVNPDPYAGGLPSSFPMYCTQY
ncbi:MAG TPA: hypothetical protein VH062_01720 [Polyangiaceae bacterium]|nr:hypothetical protein [Polyangiaceae bacterium]